MQSRDARRGVRWSCYSGFGHSPLPPLVDKIPIAARPGNCKELQRFLGLVNYYREYSSNMADVTQPLYDLARKGRDWVWDGKCESAYCKLRGYFPTN